MVPACVTLSYFFQRSSLPDRFNSITYLLRHHSYTTGYTTACGCFAVRRPMTSAITNTNVNSRYERCNARYTIPIQPISLSHSASLARSRSCSVSLYRSLFRMPSRSLLLLLVDITNALTFFTLSRCSSLATSRFFSLASSSLSPYLSLCALPLHLYA